ncbi:winged helix-turn-helix domain-containing protein [Desulforamulus aquiferis]|uniref:Stage 0 sporulation protein A homolog n=1 Tax=Desulforamulus aquiferis TaxID=1397668 RepID=A0AAW7ZDP6_9FIRM|nr:response regulator transcription factor [Desulforamulus aquiferis]MDO7787393.1 response regulator transcription factor [Desulforamulus aquiferis]RYD02398.1 PhoP family transcriptional regulator [Desulforamulus aquiferis]
MGKILVIDDEDNILELIKFNLEKDGHQVILAKNGEEGLHFAKVELPDLIILDVMIPEPDGLEVCRKLRHDDNTSSIPILMISARGDILDRVVGLEMGADDYIPKPFSPRELNARVKANLRRTKNEKPQFTSSRELKSEGLVIDVEKFQVLLNNQLINFTPKEFKLLHTLMAYPGKVFTREQLLDRVWGFEFNVDTRTVDVHVRYVRQKIEDDPSNPQYIKTVRGIGYKFVDNSNNKLP